MNYKLMNYKLMNYKLMNYKLMNYKLMNYKLMNYKAKTEMFERTSPFLLYRVPAYASSTSE
jgi:hypothetical protein